MADHTFKISIILPVYNGSERLRTAINSCLNQTYRDIELIIIDACSKDAAEIVKSYADPRIRYVRHEINSGLSYLLNAGFRHAQGDYLTWTSENNQYLPTALEEMLHFLQNRPDVDFVYSDMDVKPCTHWTFYFGNSMGACFLYTRKVYATIGEFDPCFEWVEDYDYWLRVEKKFAMRRLPKVLYLYGEQPQFSAQLSSVDLLGCILRFHHGYLSFDGFVDAGVYIVKFLPFKKDFWTIGGLVIQKVSCMGLKLQITFWLGIFCALIKKIGTAADLVWKKFFKLFNKDRDFHNILSGLNKPDTGKTQVLCIITFLTMGGLEKVMQDIVQGLSAKDYDFHLFCFKKDNNPWIQKFLSHFANFIGISALYDVDMYSDHLIRIIRKLNIKMILLTHEHMAYKSLARVREIFPDIKIVDILHLEQVGGAHQHISVIGAPYVDRRVCISRHLLTYMKKSYGIWGLSSSLAGRLQVIHNGTDVAEFSKENIPAGQFRQLYGIPEDAKIISFAARMAPEKNPFIFLDIARGIIAKNPAAGLRFVMAGNGPLWGSLKAKIKDYGLEDHFILPGVLTNVSELLRDSFLLVVVSTHEGIPLSIQEAMFMNVPVISTRVGAIHEIIHDGLNGFLIQKDEQVVDNAVARIQYFLEHDKEYQTMAVKAREDVFPEFALVTMCCRYEELFSEVLN